MMALRLPFDSGSNRSEPLVAAGRPSSDDGCMRHVFRDRPTDISEEH
jgi:hypothetical protein